MDVRGGFRIGVDVGGTFTKAIILDDNLNVIAKHIIPTRYGVAALSEGVIEVIKGVIDISGINPKDIGLVSFTTTHSVNALLEGDVYPVGLIAMSKSEYRDITVKRTNIGDVRLAGDRYLKVYYRYIDTSSGLDVSEVDKTIKDLMRMGAKAIAVNEAYGVDDPKNELLVLERASLHGIPATAGHELTMVYGLELRTITSVINASILPRMMYVASAVEKGVKRLGLNSYITVVRGDGGVSDLQLFKKKPLITVLSGPSASMMGALHYLNVVNGVFIEVGGTSTNVGIIKNGKAKLGFVRIMGHPTSIRSVDVDVVGVAGGSMVRIRKNSIAGVGPRSAHIAGLRYASFVPVEYLQDASLTFVSPMDNDPSEYVAIKSGGSLYAVTTTCAANALGLIPKGDYAYGYRESAKIAMDILGEYLGMDWRDVAEEILYRATRIIAEVLKNMKRKYGLSGKEVKLIGGGGAASVLIPYLSKVINADYEIAKNNDVISALGAALGVLTEVIERTSISSPNELSHLINEAFLALVNKGVDPSSISIYTEYGGGSSIRIVALGTLPLSTSRDGFLSIDEVKAKLVDVLGGGDVEIREVGYYIIGLKKIRSLFRRIYYKVVVMDRKGRLHLNIDRVKVFIGRGEEFYDRLVEVIGGRQIAPETYIIKGSRFMDVSFIINPNKLLEVLGQEVRNCDEDVIVLVRT